MLNEQEILEIRDLISMYIANEYVNNNGKHSYKSYKACGIVDFIYYILNPEDTCRGQITRYILQEARKLSEQ